MTLLSNENLNISRNGQQNRAYNSEFLTTRVLDQGEKKSFISLVSALLQTERDESIHKLGDCSAVKQSKATIAIMLKEMLKWTKKVASNKLQSREKPNMTKRLAKDAPCKHCL